MINADRFWAKVNKGGGDECWEWTGARSHKGHGTFRVGRKMPHAHRVAWELTHGPIPEGIHVCHQCDNPPCCNPAHLFLGTHQDNMRDMHRKGRGRYGLRLNDEQVVAIRAEYAAGGVMMADLGRKYGVVRQTISLIINGQRWRNTETEKDIST